VSAAKRATKSENHENNNSIYRSCSEHAIHPAVPGANRGADFPVSPVRLNPDVRAELERIIGKCLEKDREFRYQHASEVRADLESLRRSLEDVNSQAGVRPRAGTRRSKAVASIFLAVAAACSAGFFYFDRAPQTVAKIPLVVAEIKNNTNDRAFGGTLRQSLLVQLGKRPFEVISDEVVRRALSFMRQPPDTRLSADLARDICERTASSAVLEPSVDLLGTR
jgi:hypothetical protein